MIHHIEKPKGHPKRDSGGGNNSITSNAATSVTLPEDVFTDEGAIESTLTFDQAETREFLLLDDRWGDWTLNNNSVGRSFVIQGLTSLNRVDASSDTGLTSGEFTNLATLGQGVLGSNLQPFKATYGSTNSTFLGFTAPNVTGTVGKDSGFGLSGFTNNAQALEYLNYGSGDLDGGILLDSSGPSVGTLTITANSIGKSNTSRSVTGSGFNAKHLVVDATTVDGTIDFFSASNLESISGTIQSLGQHGDPFGPNGMPLEVTYGSANSTLKTVDLPNLTTVGFESGFNISVWFLDCRALTTVNLGNAVLDGALDMSNSGDSAQTVTATLNRCDRIQSVIGSFLGGGLECTVVTVDNQVDLASASNMSYLSFPNLISIGGVFNASGADLDQTSVDRISDQLANNNAGEIVAGLSSVNLSGGSNATPSPAGQANIDKIRNAGIPFLANGY